MDFENFSQNISTNNEVSSLDSTSDDSAQNKGPDSAVTNQEESQGQSPQGIAGKSSCKPRQKSQKMGLFVLLSLCGILALGSIINFFNKPDSASLPTDSMRNTTMKQWKN